jgi:hypothetical protein
MRTRLTIPDLVAIFLLATSTLSAQGTSSWVFFGPDGRLQYATDAQGNRVMDYSYAGYHGGGVSIPAVPAQHTVSPSGGDDTAAIQAAVDTVSSLSMDANGFRGAVLLTPGTFNLSATLNITASGVVLRGSGSGSDGTVLNMTGDPFLLLKIAGTGSYQTAGNPSASIADSYVPSGAMTLNVDDASAFAIGDPVLIVRPVTQAWVSFMSMDTLVRNGQPQTWLAAGSSITTDRTVAAIDGNQITLDVPLTDSFDSTYLNPPGGSLVKYTFPGRICQVGVEHLSVIAPPLDVDISQPQYQAISISAALNAWVWDVPIQDTQNSVSVSNNAKQITLDSVVVTHTIAHSFSDAPADFSLSGTQVLANNCSVTGVGNTWPAVTSSRVTGPVVLLNFFADDRGFDPHQRWATGLLCDGCNFPNSHTSDKAGIAYSNRGILGSGHGWDSGWAVAWNVNSTYFLVQEPPGAHNWCIGCVGTVLSEAMPGGDGTPLANGIYDSLGTPVTPSSLYLEQLCERLGPAALTNIGYSGNCVGPQRFLNADGQTDTYTLINNALGGTAEEVPDCSHPDFGPHITQAWDSDLGKYVFVFHIHVTPDNDRCVVFDRQRNEIKTYGPSPDYLKGFLGDTVTFRWRFRLDPGFQPSPSFTHIHQIKAGDGDSAAPIITLTPRSGNPDILQIIHTDSSGVSTTLLHTDLTPFEGTWVEAYEQLTYGSTGTYSIQVLNVSDGSVLLSYRNNNIDLWRMGTTFVRPKWGIYRSLNNASFLRDEQVRYGGFCLAKGSDDCPSMQ